MSCQSRFDARYWMLGAGALGGPRGMEWGGRREEGSGWGTHICLWQIHFDIWQNQYNIVKFKNKIKFKKKAISKITLKKKNSDSESFWLQDPFILLKIIENSKELCLSLLLFTILENKTEKLKIQAHTIIVANSISLSVMISHIVSLKNSTVPSEQNENGSNVYCCCENSSDLLDPLTRWVSGLQQF